MIKKILVLSISFLLLISFTTAFSYTQDFNITDEQLRTNFKGYYTSSLIDTSINSLDNSYWYIENNQLVINATNSTSYYYVELSNQYSYNWTNYQVNLTAKANNQIAGARIGVNVFSEINRTLITNMTKPKAFFTITYGLGSYYEFLSTDGFRTGDYTSDNIQYDNEWHNFILTPNSTTPSLTVKIWNTTESEPLTDDINVNVLGCSDNCQRNGSISFVCVNAICYFGEINMAGEGNDIIPSCSPDLVCSNYDTCNISDLSPCNETIDNNGCGITYTGDYTEFSPQSCNYCSADWQRDNQSCINETRLINWTDLNFATCCDITGLSSDCDNPYLNEESCSSVFHYSEDDILKATMNLVIKFLIIVSLLISLIITISIATWGKNKLLTKK